MDQVENLGHKKLVQVRTFHPGGMGGLGSNSLRCFMLQKPELNAENYDQVELNPLTPKGSPFDE